MAKVMYGGGLRLMKCLRLRIMDLDFAKSQVYVRGKGAHSSIYKGIEQSLGIFWSGFNEDIQIECGSGNIIKDSSDTTDDNISDIMLLKGFEYAL